jgi:hypothetical protein
MSEAKKKEKKNRPAILLKPGERKQKDGSAG